MFPTLTPTAHKRYVKLRLVLWLGIIIFGGLFCLSMVFPTITQTLDFDNPASSKNTLVDPRAPDTTPLTTGKVRVTAPLITNTSLLGDYSAALISLTLEDDSARPDTITATLRRAYRARLLPLGEPIASVRSENILRVDSTYYVLQADMLYPFVSDAAYRSRFDNQQLVKEVGREVLSLYPVASSPIGFRIGSLLSFADGVFIVTSENEIRPIGSAEIFLALGYRFADVKPVSEEELGLYKRGRIILLNTPHPDGTLFRDLDTDTVFLIEQGKRRIIEDSQYRVFLSGEQQPIHTRSQDTETSVHCSLTSSLFPQTYRCTLLLDDVKDHLGFDYELTLSTDAIDFEIEALHMSFDTHATLDNARTLVAKVKQRILARFGLAQP